MDEFTLIKAQMWSSNVWYKACYKNLPTYSGKIVFSCSLHLISFYWELRHTKANRFAGWEISENPSSVCLVSIFSLVVLVYHWIHKSIEYRTFPALMYCCIEKEETFFRFYFSIGVSYTVSLTRGDFKCRLILGSYRKLIHYYFFYFRVSNSRTCTCTCICTNFQSKRVIPFTCWAFKLIQNQEAFLNNINLSIFTNHMYGY